MIVPYFHITPFLARRRRNMMNLNPMAHGTENATKSVHHPAAGRRSRRRIFFLFFFFFLQWRSSNSPQ